MNLGINNCILRISCNRVRSIDHNLYAHWICILGFCNVMEKKVIFAHVAYNNFTQSRKNHQSIIYKFIHYVLDYSILNDYILRHTDIK